MIIPKIKFDDNGDALNITSLLVVLREKIRELDTGGEMIDFVHAWHDRLTGLNTDSRTDLALIQDYYDRWNSN